MKTWLLLLALWCGPVFAADSYQARDINGSTVTLWNEACEPEGAGELPRLNTLLLRAGIPEVRLSDMRRAAVFYVGKGYKACWIQMNADVLIIDDGQQDNSIFSVPIDHFQRVRGI